MRPRTPCDPQVQRPEMPLALTQVQHTKCSRQAEGSKRVDQSPVPVEGHSFTVLTVKNPAKGEIAKGWQDDEGWVVEHHPSCANPTTQGLVEREECDCGTADVDTEYVHNQEEPLPWPGHLAVDAEHVDDEGGGEPPSGNPRKIAIPWRDETRAALKEESHGEAGDPVGPGQVDLAAGRGVEVGLCQVDVQHHPQGGERLQERLQATQLAV